MKETIKEIRKSSYVVMDIYEKEQISPEFDTLKKARQYLNTLVDRENWSKYALCVVKNYTYSNEKGKFKGRYVKQHMRKLELNEEEKQVYFSILCDDRIWRNIESVREKLVQMYLWESWKSRAKSLEEQTLFEFYEKKENDVE